MVPGPLVFEPIYKPRIWGGDRIFRHFGRLNRFAEPIGESWELSDIPEGRSVVARGPEAGRTLGQVAAEWGPDLLGDVALLDGCFPLLIKFIDARQWLSVQVHPPESVARRMGGDVRVKNEAWYVLDADPDGAIYHGLEPGIDRRTFREAMISGRIEGVLRKVPARPGDCFDLPSGTVHALGAGVLVAEVQTPSDTTFRAYDWGRVDPSTGRPRALHLDEAMECIDFDAPQPPPTQPRSHMGTVSTTVTRLCACPSFIIEKVRMAEGTRRSVPYDEPVVWIVLEGGGRIVQKGRGEPTAFSRGDVLLLPAALGEATVEIDRDTQWLEASIPVRGSIARTEDRP